MSSYMNQPQFVKPLWRITGNTIQCMSRLQHLARCDGTGETFYLCRGVEYSEEEVATWFTTLSAAKESIT